MARNKVVQVLNVCTAFDKSFVVPANVMMRSVAKNTNQRIHFHLLVPKSEFWKQKSFFTPIGLPENCLFTFYQIDDSRFSTYLRMNGTRHFSNAAIFRLFMTDYIPSPIDTILYLDGDLVVNLDISEIFSSYSDNFFSARPEKMNEGYFNSGVFLTSLNYWREHNVKLRLLDFLIQNPSLEYKDQDSLNHVFKSLNIPMEERFNFPFGAFRRYGRSQSRECIFHFTGSIKPWKQHAPNVFPVKLWRSLYFEIYETRTPLQMVRWAHLKKVIIMARLFVKL